MASASLVNRKSPSDVFASAVTGNLASSTKSNAPLDPPTMARLATGIIGPSPTVKTLSASARAIDFRVLYSIEGASSGPVLLDFVHCTEAAAAQDLLKQYLGTFDGDVSAVTQKTTKPLGQVSLQTGTSVFWVRDAIWVRVQSLSSEVPKASPTPPSMKLSPQTAGTLPAARGGPTTSAPAAAAPSSTGPAASTANPVLAAILLPFAESLDAHLLKFAVPPNQQFKPNTAVKTSSYKGPRGTEFSFQLAEATGTHAIKPAQPAAGDAAAGRIVSPTRNGSATGEYRFLGQRIGKGKVQLIVARADNLAVGAAEVTVEITAK
ncbi:hypothetical protein B0T26DRAFT_803382 [Lasiosphaeria miniovina]|uniref:Uncharacterized protein n=1 Tax=Lasiosphaeria miniovina TaxID=1954250 RepID=A0AA40DYP6_9PEZI|nr:uncharacterized protein B0T26DRAFT_803382 [Lasiosphaeria miniovina]KAK0718567.1 hypothetical protein B0T26DRAFT_803382 [Lasiosphaeria miniovina]